MEAISGELKNSMNVKNQAGFIPRAPLKIVLILNAV
jgi:hypothetical protein